MVKEYNNCFDYFLSLKDKAGVNLVAVNISYYMLGEYITVKGNGLDLTLKTPSEINAEQPAFKAKVKELADAGILLVTLANNFSTNHDTHQMTTKDGPIYVKGLEWPGALDMPNILSVAGTNAQGKLVTSSGSSFGRHSVDLVAPGSEIVSTWSGDSYIEASGTSMAAPMVTGAIALLASQFPDKSIYELKALLMSSGKPLPEWTGKLVSNNLARLVEMDTSGNVTGGALGCQDRPLKARQMPIENSFTMTAATPLEKRRLNIDVLNVNCGIPVEENLVAKVKKLDYYSYVNQKVVENYVDESVIPLRDNGNYDEANHTGDIIADDGAFRGTWTAGEINLFKQKRRIDAANLNDSFDVTLGSRGLYYVPVRTRFFFSWLSYVAYDVTPVDFNNRYTIKRKRQSDVNWVTVAEHAYSGTIPWIEFQNSLIKFCVEQPNASGILVATTDCSVPIKFPSNILDTGLTAVSL